jgi:hypothetical protein
MPAYSPEVVSNAPDRVPIPTGELIDLDAVATPEKFDADSDSAVQAMKIGFATSCNARQSAVLPITRNGVRV